MKRIGLAFDGDADRMLAVDEKGDVVDGDQVMAIIGNYMKAQGKLKKDTIVGTVMSNLGFTLMGKEHGIHIEQTKVGDRYVLENMRENGYNIGGEQSGHIIFLDYATTGDGQLTAVQLLNLLAASGERLDQLISEIPDYPQVLVNVVITENEKGKWDKIPAITDVIDNAMTKMGKNGRILVRESGTEPLIRVMVEGTDYESVHFWSEKIASVIEKELCAGEE